MLIISILKLVWQHEITQIFVQLIWLEHLIRKFALKIFAVGRIPSRYHLITEVWTSNARHICRDSYIYQQISVSLTCLSFLVASFCNNFIIILFLIKIIPLKSQQIMGFWWLADRVSCSFMEVVMFFKFIFFSIYFLPCIGEAWGWILFVIICLVSIIFNSRYVRPTIICFFRSLGRSVHLS